MSVHLWKTGHGMSMIDEGTRVGDGVENERIHVDTDLPQAREYVHTRVGSIKERCRNTETDRIVTTLSSSIFPATSFRTSRFLLTTITPASW